MHKIAVLISGEGTNLKAICESQISSSIACVISNNPNANGIKYAKQAKLDTHVIDHTQFTSREAFDQELAKIIDKYQPKFIILAGFMRILSSWFINYYKNRIINTHPSLLPSFRGKNAVCDALNAKVKLTGVTVHFVTDKLDSGPIIAQGVVPVYNIDDEIILKDRVKGMEHVLYPFIIHKLVNDKVSLNETGLVTVNKTHEDKSWLKNLDNQIFINFVD